jgi:hypothetical protein
MYMYQTSTVNDLVYMCQRYRLFLCFYDIFYCTCTLIIMIIKDIIETETIDTSDTCIHDRSLYWSGTCTLIIIIIKYIIETEKQSISLTHVYKIVHCTGLLMYMYQTSTVNGLVYMCQRYRLFLCFYDSFYYYYY